MSTKRLILIAAVVVAIPVLATGWWLLSPLFINTTVSEDFPLSASAEMPPGVSQEEAESIMSGIAKINMEANEAMPPEMSDAELIKRGQFRDGDSFHKGSGDAALYRLPDGRAVLRFEGLDVTNGPALHVILTPHPNPGGRDEVHQSGYSDLGRLKGNRGDQNYELPPRADLDSIGSVVIYCMPFHVVFSVATLENQG